MTRFNVTGKVTITVTTIVEAESEAEACAVASERYTSGSLGKTPVIQGRNGYTTTWMASPRLSL